MKNYMVLLLLLLGWLPLKGQSYLDALYINDLNTVDAYLANENVNMSLLLSMYLANAAFLDEATVSYLLDNKAGLDVIIRDIYQPKSTFQSSDVEPSPALIRLLKDNALPIIDLLADTAKQQGSSYNFYFGSYANNTLGSNGLLGAALSKNYQASTALIKQLWTRATPFYKSGALIAYRYPIVIALTDNYEALLRTIAAGSGPETFWKYLIDFRATKSIKALIDKGMVKMFLLDDRFIYPIDYATELGYTEIVKLLASTPPPPR